MFSLFYTGFLPLSTRRMMTKPCGAPPSTVPSTPASLCRFFLRPLLQSTSATLLCHLTGCEVLGDFPSKSHKLKIGDLGERVWLERTCFVFFRCLIPYHFLQHLSQFYLIGQLCLPVASKPCNYFATAASIYYY